MKFDPPLFVTVVVTSSEQLASVYALLGGAAAIAAAPAPGKATSAEPVNTQAIETGSGSDGSAPSAGEAVSQPVDESIVDAHGWPWSAELHASTRGTTKDGLWRMKVGVVRPDPKPGFPIEGAGSTSTASTGTAESSQSAAAPAETAGAVEEDDEFAAFRAASDNLAATGAAAAASIPARKWTDADLGALCNQAAVKLGDPTPVKALIEKFVADGEVAHSRNIAEDKREAFAAAVEEKAGITFAG